MRALLWSRPAQSDLREIDAYYRPLNPDFARNFAVEAVRAGAFLTENPDAGPVIERTNKRKWRVGRTPYTLIYRPTVDTIRILRVVHAARDWTRFL